jgi:hypothetical protein
MRFSDFLEKYTSLVPRERQIKEAVTGALKEILSLEIDPSHIVVKEKTAFLNVSPTLKHTILSHKHEIQKHIKTTHPTLDCPDLL